MSDQVLERHRVLFREIIERQLAHRAECEDHATELQGRLRLERIKIDVLMSSVPDIIEGERNVPDPAVNASAHAQWQTEWAGLMEQVVDPLDCQRRIRP